MSRERWLLLILVLIFVALGVHNVSPKWSSLQEVKAADDGVPWGRNPFLTEEEEVGEREPESASLKVKAIIVGHPRSVANIDGHTVVVGEKIGEETIVEILRDAVVLERDGGKRVLRVTEPSISIQVKGAEE